jgi:hypothetical protein
MQAHDYTPGGLIDGLVVTHIKPPIRPVGRFYEDEIDDPTDYPDSSENCYLTGRICVRTMCPIPEAESKALFGAQLTWM